MVSQRDCKIAIQICIFNRRQSIHTKGHINVPKPGNRESPYNTQENRACNILDFNVNHPQDADQLQRHFNSSGGYRTVP